MKSMSVFDLNAPAELFACRNRRGRRQDVHYRRFSTAAAAIRYAVEELDTGLLAGTVIEAAEERITGTQIRDLYEHADFPGQRSDA